MNRCLPFLVLGLLVLLPTEIFGGSTAAGPLPERADALGGAKLTPVGAERAGNAEGTIPEWTGGIKVPPAGFNPGDRHLDPYADDPVLFTINAENVAQHADKLSEGQLAMFRQHPDSWYMNIYPSHRSAAFPDFVYEAMQDNARHARLISEGLGGVEGTRITSPFPLPEEGVEVVWNHLLRWHGIRVSRINGQAAVTRRGNYRVILFQEEFASPYARPVVSSFSKRHPDTAFAFMQKILAPGSEAGFGQLAHDTHNYTRAQRQSWVYNPNLRRVLRSPLSGFDNPAPLSDGLRWQDENGMFNGTPALFNWKLLGKRELYIPYNSYRLENDDLSYEDVLHREHLNPDTMRYELHRVWVVEGTVRTSSRNRRALDPTKRGHAYSKRVFYIDEDSWQIAVADSYDESGAIWRTAEGHSMNFYDLPAPMYVLEVFYDFKAQRYLAKGLDSRFGGTRVSDLISPNDFSPLALEYFVR